MEIQTVDTILGRIAEAHRVHADGVVAFDGDGTLWTGDVGEDFFQALLEKNDFRPSAYAQMRADAREFGIKDDGDALRVAERLFAEYMAGQFPEERICELIAWACAEWTSAEVDAFAAEMLTQRSLVPRLHKEAQRVLAWVREQKLEVLVVSASPRAIVEAAVKVAGLTPDRVVAATPIVEANRLLAKVHRPIPYGPGKVRALRERIGDRALYAAFGDNAFDVALLSEAFVPVAVRPKPRLRERAHEVKNLVEIQHES
jgi:phosphoserine phosphatase